MQKTTIFSLLAKHYNQIEDYGVERIGLFGSYVRNEQTESSDIDFLVEFSKEKKNIHNLVGLGDFLEKLFGKKVELVTKESLSKYIGPHILKEVQYASFAN
jgi:predicted nucleotidyltransferase